MMLESVSYDAPSGFGSRVIKRYSNRKLYDTKSSRYVTLLQIAQMVRSGEEVQIIDNRTKEDKTEVTLALIISEELKNSPGGISLTTLKALIRHDSTPPPSGEQPTFSGARLLGLLGVSEVHARPGLVARSRFGAAGVEREGDGGVGDEYSFANTSEEMFAEQQESSMSDTAGISEAAGGPSAGPQVRAEKSPERQLFEQWRSELEARVSRLPDPQVMVALQGQVQRLDERVAELEQRLSKHQE